MPSSDTLRALFHPRGIAVIGASARPTSLGYAVARNLLRGRHGAAVHLVNPKGGTLFGHPVYPSVLEVPDPVDLAVIVVPAAVVPQVLDEAGRRGIRAAIVQAGGFAEEGPEGRARQARLLDIARTYGLRLLGPNGIGLIDFHQDLNTTFLPPPFPRPGGLAFFSQSGALAAALLDWGLAAEQGFSLVVSTGNQADVTMEEVLEQGLRHQGTRVVLVYLEDAVDRALVAALRDVTLHKPAIVLKAGKTTAGQRAAASHTAALATPWARAKAGLRRAGVLLARDVRRALTWARALALASPRAGLPYPARVAILTNAGGPGVLAADAVGASPALRLAPLSEATQTALREGLPPAASVANPVDMLATASPEQYARSLHILLQAPEVDGVVVLLPPPPGYSAGAVAKALIPVVQQGGKPVTVALLGGYLLPEARAHLLAAEIPVFDTPEEAVAGLAAWAQAEQGRRHAQASVVRELPAIPLEPLQARLHEHDERGWLHPQAVAALLDAYRIPRVPEVWAVTPDEAMQAAAALGYPVVLKVWARGVVHKRAADGVRIGLRDAAAVRAQVRDWQQIFSDKYQGVILQPVAADGPELIVGGVGDDHLGPLVMLGLGGSGVEALGEPSFALAPLTEPDVDALLEESRVRAWLVRQGYEAQVDAVRRLLVRVGSLLADVPLRELDLNPVRVTRAGPVVLDARARVPGAERGARG